VVWALSALPAPRAGDHWRGHLVCRRGDTVCPPRAAWARRTAEALREPSGSSELVARGSGSLASERPARAPEWAHTPPWWPARERAQPPARDRSRWRAKPDPNSRRWCTRSARRARPARSPRTHIQTKRRKQCGKPRLSIHKRWQFLPPPETMGSLFAVRWRFLHERGARKR
jgi:hypothetical protein